MADLHLPGFSEEDHHPESGSTPTATATTPKETAVDKPPQGPFVLNEALPVVPAKLVKKILKGEFIDMCELLKDNIEVARRRSLNESKLSSDPLLKASMREVPDLLSWLQCFSLFAGVVLSQYPEKAKDLFAYQALMQ